MKKVGTRLMKLGLVFLSLLAFLMSTGGALGIVWVRQQISSIAESCIEKEKELVCIQRRQNSMESKIAEFHNPESLKMRVGEKLIMPSKKQIVWVQPMDLNHPIAIVAERNKALCLSYKHSLYNKR